MFHSILLRGKSFLQGHVVFCCLHVPLLRLPSCYLCERMLTQCHGIWSHVAHKPQHHSLELAVHIAAMGVQP